MTAPATPRPVALAETMRERGHTTFTVGDRFWSARPGGSQSEPWRAAMKAATAA